MSLDLFVYVPELPADVIGQWEQQLAGHGLVCSFFPGFQITPWADSFVPLRVQVTPDAFPSADRYGARPLLAEFELEVETSAGEFFSEWKANALQHAPPAIRPRLDRATQCLYFRTAAGRTLIDLRLQYFAAATLAVLSDGVVDDPQEGQYFVGNAALVHAARRAEAYETRAEPNEWQLPIFTGWPTD